MDSSVKQFHIYAQKANRLEINEFSEKLLYDCTENERCQLKSAVS